VIVHATWHKNFQVVIKHKDDTIPKIHICTYVTS